MRAAQIGGARGSARRILAASDIDNVLAMIVDSARRVLAADFGLALEDIELTHVYHSAFTHKDPEMAARLKVGHSFWERPEVLEGCEAAPGSVAAMRMLAEEGLLAGYVTRRPPHVAHLTEAWLRHQGYPDLPVHHVGTDNAATNYETCKSEACRVMNATHLIDDHATEVASCHEAGIELIVVDAELGRAARRELLARLPSVPLVPDAAAAADLILSMHRRLAA